MADYSCIQIHAATQKWRQYSRAAKPAPALRTLGYPHWLTHTHHKSVNVATIFAEINELFVPFELIWLTMGSMIFCKRDNPVHTQPCQFKEHTGTGRGEAALSTRGSLPNSR